MTLATRAFLAAGLALLNVPLAWAQEKAPVQELYRVKCQQCHMPDGNAPLEPMNLADANWVHGSKPAEVAKVISEGLQGTAMLSFKSQLTPDEVVALAEYVRSFDKTLKSAKPRKK